MIIVFDLDGTLVDSFEAHYQSAKKVLEEYGIELEREVLMKYFGINLKDIIRNIGKEYGIEIDENKLRKIIEKKNKYFKGLIHLVKLRENAKETLKKFKNLGIKLVLWSNSNKKDVMEMVERFGLKEYFDLILTADDVPPKPDPTGFEFIRKNLGDEKIIYIGDRWIDEETGKKAGIPYFILGKDFKDFRELFSLVKSLIEKTK